MFRRLFIAGNWKMHGTFKKVTKLLEDLKYGCGRVETAELAVFPPYLFIPQCKRVLVQTQIVWGAQNVSEYEDGAYTGEVSATMLRDFSCRYVIVGHSERRRLYKEKNKSVIQKIQKSVENGIFPVLCIGETKEQRAEGKTLEVIREQLAIVLRMHENSIPLYGIIIAYEPIWAVGTGESATPVQVETIHTFIREQLKLCDIVLAESTRILYGGSVQSSNAKDFFQMSNVDGVLVGKASLQAEQFLQIGEQCN
ncbi:triose-phosphate isomerase [Coxiella endosymbiont of Amblyomma sculptum]|uniref:triose-phosphate isomerase n=1 Tax=Coxiella endosymbiont of Amblyomma sculptum TaxID=2487929 RepID=UPI00132ECBED|nr:triose-phosphate isomerase [Coxiella endosymbiont of Amblyomma sculptum]QHG92307.1 triose-phosphate isomerase [Coxiella endosymbiont of Amblyomma sculptum]